ncbi:hypothetical protein ABS198_20220, partial [Acinetobacter baumannii]|uniref:hypothetical protein n=1 Tax=Acinetobacter baumannii TaxID=470 RepID=UPI00331D261A
EIFSGLAIIGNAAEANEEVNATASRPQLMGRQMLRLAKLRSSSTGLWRFGKLEDSFMVAYAVVL